MGRLSPTWFPVMALLSLAGVMKTERKKNHQTKAASTTMIVKETNTCKTLVKTEIALTCVGRSWTRSVYTCEF